MRPQREFVTDRSLRGSTRVALPCRVDDMRAVEGNLLTVRGPAPGRLAPSSVDPKKEADRA